MSPSILTLKTKFIPLLIAVLMMGSEAANSAVATQREVTVQSHVPKVSVNLSKKERKWLAQHKNIRIAYDGSLPPYSFVNEHGKVDGIAYEIISIIGKKLGINFLVHSDSNWNRLYKSAAERKVDVVATMVGRSDRDHWFVFTKPYLTKSLVVVTRQDNDTIHNRYDLADKKIAVVKGYQYGEQVGREFPHSKRVKVNSMLSGLKAVDKGSVDAAILFLGAANYLQPKNHLSQLKVTTFYERNSANESIAVRKDWPQLLDILQKGLDSLTEQEVQKIFAKWVVQGGDITTAQNVVGAKTAEAKATAVEVKKTTQVVVTGLPPTVSTVDSQPVAAKSQKIQSEPKSFFNFTRVQVGIFFGVIGLVLALNRKKWKQRAKAASTQVMNNLLVLKDEADSIKQLSPADTDHPLSLAAPETDQAIVFSMEHLTESSGRDHALGYNIVYYQRDAQGNFSFVSPSIKTLLGYSEVDFIQNYRTYLTQNPINQQWDADFESNRQGRSEESYKIELYDARKAVHHLMFKDSAIYDGAGHCIGTKGVIQDLSAQKYDGSRDDVASESSAHDDKQFLLLLKDHLKRAITHADESKKPFALVSISLERLRYLDGSSISFYRNEVLQESVKRLNATLRDMDTLLLYSDEKFWVILPETDGQLVSLHVDRIRKILQVEYLVGIQTIELDAKFGFAFYPNEGMDAELLIDLAQDALRTQQRNNPLNKIFDYSHSQRQNNIQLQQDLVLALDECKLALRTLHAEPINELKTHSQFSIYYQSQHSLENYDISGFEAVIYWQHPDFGQLALNDYAGLIKDIGLLDVMIRWTVQQVSLQTLVWEKNHIRSRPVSINLSGLIKDAESDIAKIITIVKESRVKLEWFTFSFTETEVAENPNQVISWIKQLAEAGFSVEICDFSLNSILLNRLKSLPVGSIAIDMSFMDSLTEPLASTAQVDALSKTIKLMHEFGKKVIAKGLETEQQMNLLKEIGCDGVQGHLLSRPLPAKEVIELIESFPDVA